MVAFRLAKHSVRPNVELVEIILNGDVVGAIYPNKDGIVVVSAHFSTKNVPEGFDGEVIEDSVEGSFPPIPSAKITFKPRKYIIVRGKIQYLE